MSTGFDGIILALDLASVTGWCVGKPGRAPEKFGTIKLTTKGATRGLTYHTLRFWCEAMMVEHEIDLVVYESPAIPSMMSGHTNINTIRQLIGMCEHVESLCSGKAEVREVSVSSVRVHFIGKNMKRKEAKAATIEQCRQLGWMVDNDNEADACALWSYQVCKMRPDIAVEHMPMFAKRKVVSVF